MFCLNHMLNKFLRIIHTRIRSGTVWDTRCPVLIQCTMTIFATIIISISSYNKYNFFISLMLVNIDSQNLYNETPQNTLFMLEYNYHTITKLLYSFLMLLLFLYNTMLLAQVNPGINKQIYKHKYNWIKFTFYF